MCALQVSVLRPVLIALLAGVAMQLAAIRNGECSAYLYSM